MPDPAEIEMMRQMLAQGPRVPLSGVKGPDGQQAYAPPGTPEPPSVVPSWYRDIQPYPISPRATLEGVLAAGIPAGGSVGPQITDAVGRAAGSPMARALAGSLGFGAAATSPTVAGDAGKAAPPGSSVAPTQENLKSLLEQRALLAQQTEAARRNREDEKKTGKGKNYGAADAEFQSLNNKLTALDTLIATEQKKGSPEALLEAQKAQDDFARKGREKTMNTSIKEMAADFMPYAPIASGIGAMLLGGKIKGSYVSKFNEKVDDLMGRQQAAIQSGNKPLAQALQTEFEALQKAGPGGTGKALAGGAIVGELGQLGPVVSDYAKALPGSTLYDKTVKTMTDPWEVGGRVASGLMWGMGPAEIAALWKGRGAKSPLGFGAETNSMPDPRRLPPPLPPNNPPIEGGPLTPVPGGPGGGGVPQLPGPGLGQKGAISNRDLMEALKQNPPANVNETKKAVPIKGKDGRTRYHDPDSGDFAPKDLPKD